LISIFLLFLIGYGREYPLPKVGGGLEGFNYRSWKLTPKKKIKKFLGKRGGDARIVKYYYWSSLMLLSKKKIIWPLAISLCSSGRRKN